MTNHALEFRFFGTNELLDDAAAGCSHGVYQAICMDVCMDGCMDGWMNEWMDSLVSMEEIQVLNDTEGEEEKL
jgi:hypothetical protein